jgi:hypothetical protein
MNRLRQIITLFVFTVLAGVQGPLVAAGLAAASHSAGPGGAAGVSQGIRYEPVSATFNQSGRILISCGSSTREFGIGSDLAFYRNGQVIITCGGANRPRFTLSCTGQFDRYDGLVTEDAYVSVTFTELNSVVIGGNLKLGNYNEVDHLIINRNNAGPGRIMTEIIVTNLVGESSVISTTEHEKDMLADAPAARAIADGPPGGPGVDVSAAAPRAAYVPCAVPAGARAVPRHRAIDPYEDERAVVDVEQAVVFERIKSAGLSAMVYAAITAKAQWSNWPTSVQNFISYATAAHVAATLFLPPATVWNLAKAPLSLIGRIGGWFSRHKKVAAIGATVVAAGLGARTLHAGGCMPRWLTGAALGAVK